MPFASPSSGVFVRSTTTVTIANGASLSDAADLNGYRVTAIDMPATWTAANLTFQGSNDNVTYQNIYDDAGLEVQITATNSRNIALSAEYALALMAHRYIKVRSGTSGTPVNQGGARTVTLVLVSAWA